MEIKIHFWKTLEQIEEIVNSSKRRIKDIALYPCIGMYTESFHLLIKYE